MYSFKCRFDAGGGAVFEWDGENGVAVVVIAYKLIIVAVAGWCNKFAGLISVDLASGRHIGKIA